MDVLLDPVIERNKTTTGGAPNIKNSAMGEVLSEARDILLPVLDRISGLQLWVKMEVSRPGIATIFGLGDLHSVPYPRCTVLQGS